MKNEKSWEPWWVGFQSQLLSCWSTSRSKLCLLRYTISAFIKRTFIYLFQPPCRSLDFKFWEPVILTFLTQSGRQILPCLPMLTNGRLAYSESPPIWPHPCLFPFFTVVSRKNVKKKTNIK